MSRSWNGESLVDELSQFLGDTSTSFKYKVLGWLNDVIFDISSRHDWGHHLTKGKKILSAMEEIHDLEVKAPGKPTIEGDEQPGDYAIGSIYRVLITFVQANGVESIAGEESDAVSASDNYNSFLISDIPVSDESCVTKRRVYLSKDEGKFYFLTEIDDNFTTSLRIESEAESEIEPPDYESIRRLKGSPFFEDSGADNYLEYRDVDQLRKLIPGRWEIGDPEFFSPIESNKITTYPIPSLDMELSFNYYRRPFRLYYEKTSQPDLPIDLKEVLRAGVIAKGFEYRDRNGAEMKEAKYQNALVDAINRGGRVANIEYQVRDVYGNTDGFEVV